jgi:iron complex transport system ATP-binding protein
MHDAPILEVTALSLMSGSKTLVDSLSFSLGAGKILAVMGPNGAGKSSLLRGILGLLPHRAGSVKILGQSIEARPADERAKVVAYVPQQSALNLDLTVESVVQMGRFAHRHDRGLRAAHNASIVLGAMQQCDVHHLAERRFLSLSGGERGRVLIARALATEAPLMLLDEPTHCLDVLHVLDCLGYLRRLASDGKTIVMVTHDLNHLAGFADEVLLMKASRKVAMGSPQALLSDPLVEQAFGVKLLANAAYGYCRWVDTEAPNS